MSGTITASRRHWLQSVTASSLGLSASGWLPQLASAAADDPTRKRSCILLWMNGGPSQTDTFDPKPEHKNGGPFRAISTATPGLFLGEHLSKLAAHSEKLAVVRSMETREGDHGRATFHLRTGNLPQGAIQFPVLGSLVANERQESHDLPGFISVTPPRLFAPESISAGFLGPRFAPLMVGREAQADYRVDAGGGVLKVQDLERARGIDSLRSQDRLDLLAELTQEFTKTHPGLGTAGHRTAYEQARRLMQPEAAGAFDLDEEPAALRDRYGRHRFGQGCLLARRLIERKVPFVEVTLGGWDTHDDNFKKVADLCNVLDPAWSTLLDDLSARGLLDDTLVVCMGEFGRTPGINPRQGRDHYPHAWSVVLSGGGIRGGSIAGRTGNDGMIVEDRPTSVPDLLATILLALGLDPRKQNMSNVNRPIRLADPDAKPLSEILA
jgi:uncharacterized protein (DUF1501 family)